MNDNQDVIELLDLLYGMVNEAWGVPLGNDKCIIEREKAIDIINEIKTGLPSSIAEAKRLVSARDEFIGSAKREAESLRKKAEDDAARMLDEQEIIKLARRKADEMIKTAEQKSAELRRLAGEYADEMLRKSEKSLSEALESVRQTQAAFRNNSSFEEKVEKAPEEPKTVAQPAPEQKVRESKKPVIFDLPVE